MIALIAFCTLAFVSRRDAVTLAEFAAYPAAIAARQPLLSMQYSATNAVCLAVNVLVGIVAVSDRTTPRFVSRRARAGQDFPIDKTVLEQWTAALTALAASGDAELPLCQPVS